MPPPNPSIVIDACIMVDLAGSCSGRVDASRKEFCDTASQLFSKMKGNVTISIDDKGKIFQEYTAGGILKNEHLRAMFPNLVQRMQTVHDWELPEETRKKLRILGMKGARDPIYIGVANKTPEKRIIVTRNSDFYDPKRASSYGEPGTCVAKYLKKELRVYPMLSKQVLNEPLICKS